MFVDILCAIYILHPVYCCVELATWQPSPFNHCTHVIMHASPPFTRYMFGRCITTVWCCTPDILTVIPLYALGHEHVLCCRPATDIHSGLLSTCVPFPCVTYCYSHVISA